MGDIPPPPTTPKPSRSRWPLEWTEWVERCKEQRVSPRAAALASGMTPSQISGQYFRLAHPPANPSVRRSQKSSDPNAWDSGGWSESRLTEPWKQYTARKQAERQARANHKDPTNA